MRNTFSEFSRVGNWYKANLHIHTTTSDGDKPLAERVQQYKQAGYSVLAITDHVSTNDVTKLSDDKILVISGVECPLMKAPWPEGMTHDENCVKIPGRTPPSAIEMQKHILGELLLLNVKHPQRFGLDRDAQETINYINANGGICFIPHPYWSGLTTEHLMKLTGYIGIEVFNASTIESGRPVSSVIWDELLEAGRVVWGIATDDIHCDDHFQKGWVMIKSTSLEIANILQALKDGMFYSSMGPEIYNVKLIGQKVYIECSPVREVYCMGARGNGESVILPCGKTDIHFELHLRYIDLMHYLRIELVDENNHRAWTNPIILSV